MKWGYRDKSGGVGHVERGCSHYGRLGRGLCFLVYEGIAFLLGRLVSLL